MDEQYDVIVLGTGLTECILSGLLSVEGKKVLHIDRQDFYGGESALLNLTQLYGKFRPGRKPDPAFGKDRDWCVDLIPKFLMASGDLTNILVHTDVTRYIEFKQITGLYVYRDGRIAKVPANEVEALKLPLMGIFEKRRMKRFLEFVAAYNDDDVSTHHLLNLDTNTSTEVFAKYGLERGTQDFIGHAMALYLNDDYLNQPFRETYDRLTLYFELMRKFGGGKLPYIYPLYGLGELPQGFARLLAIYGGTYMLDTPIDEVLYEDGKFAGVVTKEGTAKAPIVIADPTYFPEKVEKTGQRVIRAMCILDHPVLSTLQLDSVQIIIPQNQVGRKNDIYIAVVGEAHHVCAKGHYLAIVSTVCETDTPHIELEPAFKLLGKTEDVLMGLLELYVPKSDGKEDGVYLSKSYDPSSHFETTTQDVRDIYKRVMGHDLVLTKRKTAEEEEAAANVV